MNTQSTATVVEFRTVERLVQGIATSDGAGVRLTRVLTQPLQRRLDPFLMLDAFRNENPDDYIGGFPDHPHRGFETVTYMLEGAMLHRDHLGNEGHLRAGSVQWMTAAHGIIHSEMPEQEDGLLHGFQLWINLPAKDKMKPPHYQEFAANEIPQVTLANGGTIKIIAGDYSGGEQKVSGPVIGVAAQPLYFDVLLSRQQNLVILVDEQHTVVIYVYEGELTIGESDKTLKAGQLGQIIDGNELSVQTKNHPVRFLLLAAMPLKEPVVQSRPFVMNSKEEIE